MSFKVAVEKARLHNMTKIPQLHRDIAGSMLTRDVYYINCCPHLVKYIEPDASAAITVEVYTILATAAAAAAPSCFPAAATATVSRFGRTGEIISMLR